MLLANTIHAGSRTILNPLVIPKKGQMSFLGTYLSFCRFSGKGHSSIAAILEENKRLKQDKERLTEKLSQSKGALRETLDRLHKKDASTLSPLPSRRIFSSAVAAAVSNQPPPSLKDEFLAFSKSHRFKSGGKSKKNSESAK